LSVRDEYELDRRHKNEALARKVSPAASGKLEGLRINLPSPGFYGEHGFQLYNRKVRDQ